ncbi:hypothetical protein ACL9RL_07040 [Plantibacter sp. Mn2098]|uniref:hypothetical protein n=1 Tax=Plantibacter sp. Mn2098 TaxID=3395266 RepID=UPI003BBC8B66
MSDDQEVEHNTWDFSVPEFRAEAKLMHDNDLDPEMTETEHQDYWAQLRGLLWSAQCGTLNFGGKNPEAKVMELRDHIIELRPLMEAAPGTVFGKTMRLVRLYFAEPVLPIASLLALHLATKPNGPDDAAEQNAAIVEASDRAEVWQEV